MRVSFSTIEWNLSTIQIPNDSKVYRMRNLVVLQDDDEDVMRYYSLIDNRTKRLICSISVDHGEAAQFKQFQNMLLISKL